ATMSLEGSTCEQRLSWSWAGAVGAGFSQHSDADAGAWSLSLHSSLQGSLWCLQMRMQQHSTHPTVWTVERRAARTTIAVFIYLRNKSRHHLISAMTCPSRAFFRSPGTSAVTRSDSLL